MATATTPLHDLHQELEAKMVPFAGYSMPIQYQGVIAEATAVRQSAGLFDVSHMARFAVSGPRAIQDLERITTNRVAKLEPGDGQYTLLTNPQGGVIDDLILYRTGTEAFILVANAANHRAVAEWLNAHAGSNTVCEDHTDSTFMLALQGPAAAEVLGEAVATALPPFGITQHEWFGVPLWLARSGYTGEDGFEIVGPAEAAEALWRRLMELGAVPAGLAARDALRVEAGLPLYGHELAADRNPYTAGLAPFIDPEKPFIGAEKIRAEREAGLSEKLMGIRLPNKRLLLPNSPVRVAGETVGIVTSGVYSVVRECGIGLAFVNSALKPGLACEVELRGQAQPAELHAKRFLPKRSIG